MEYTPEQIEAIEHRSGNLQILACAGSGKTEVISKRVAALVAEGVPKDALVAFTFTDRAAEELKVRIRRHLEERMPLDPSLGDMYVGTIHSFCLRLLKDLNAVYRKFEVMSEARQSALIMSNYNYYTQSDSGIGIAKLRDRTRSRGYWDAIRTFASTMSIVHQKDIDIKHMNDADLKSCIRRYEKIAYADPNYFFDFDQIIGRFVRHLQEQNDDLVSLRRQFQYLIVDEYQDTDDRQEELISLISNEGKDVYVTVVGDDDQAIYGWRGARIDNILTFSERYPDVTQIKLINNFRSTHAITEIADAAVRKIPPQNRLTKDMQARHWETKTGSFVETMAEPKDIRVRTFPDEEAEAEWVADRIGELRGTLVDEGDGHTRAIDYADMSILLRSVRSSGKVFSETLRRRRIPVVVKGVGGLFDHDEILLVQATFCLLARSEMITFDSGAIVRLNETQIRDFVRKKIRSLRDVMRVMQHANEATYLEWVAAKREELDRRDLERQRRGRLARRIYPQYIFQEMLRELGAHYGPKPWPDAVLYNLGRLSGLIADFESVHQWVTPRNLRSLCLFLGGWAANQVDEGGLEEGVTLNAVQIMTVHAAKGLEWPVVFIPRVSSANFPSSYRNRGPSTFLNVDTFDPSEYASGDDGERRLWYVAVTRCRRFLNISSPDRRNKKPTDYFKEIKHDIVGRDEESVNLPKDTPTPPSKTEFLPTTYTELNYYWRCPFEYQIRALMGFEPGVLESYGYGQQIHNILAEIHQFARNGQYMSVDQISELVNRRFHLRYTRDGVQYKPLTQLRNAAKRSINRYLENYPETAKFVLDAEKPFEFIDRESGALISGTVDLIQRVEHTTTGKEERIPVAIVDFKAHSLSDATEFAVRRKEAEVQLQLYAVAVGEAWRFDAEQGIAHFLSPKPPPKTLVDQGVVERVQVDVGPESQDIVRQQVRGAVTGIKKSVTNGSFALEGSNIGHCPKCDFRRICPGYTLWEKKDYATPRPKSPELASEHEMSLVAKELNAG